MTDPLYEPAEALNAPTTYDWSRWGRHRLRAPGLLVIDHPCARGPHPEAWIATTWPDAAGQWAIVPWLADTTRRGWLLPENLALADIIEFGRWGLTPWYGLVEFYEPGTWLTLRGPYLDPARAAIDAERLLAGTRWAPTASYRLCRHHRRPA